MVQKIIGIDKGYVTIVIPEGMTMLDNGIEVPAPNWTTCIPATDTQALLKYLTQEQINQLI